MTSTLTLPADGAAAADAAPSFASRALSLAYASTIHKVQGSEFPCIVVVLHGSHHVLLNRALIYTAVTRAQRLVVLIGEDRAIRRAIHNADLRHTNSKLSRRLKNLAST